MHIAQLGQKGWTREVQWEFYFFIGEHKYEAHFSAALLYSTNAAHGSQIQRDRGERSYDVTSGAKFKVSLGVE